MNHFHFRAFKKQLKIQEGHRNEIYLDSKGLKTFGIGHLVKKGDPEYGKPVGTPVPSARVDVVFEQDVQANENKVLTVIY